MKMKARALVQAWPSIKAPMSFPHAISGCSPRRDSLTFCSRNCTQNLIKFVEVKGIITLLHCSRELFMRHRDFVKPFPLRRPVTSGTEPLPDGWHIRLDFTPKGEPIMLASNNGFESDTVQAPTRKVGPGRSTAAKRIHVECLATDPSGKEHKFWFALNTKQPKIRRNHDRQGGKQLEARGFEPNLLSGCGLPKPQQTTGGQTEEAAQWQYSKSYDKLLFSRDDPPDQSLVVALEDTAEGDFSFFVDRKPVETEWFGLFTTRAMFCVDHETGNGWGMTVGSSD
jgi:hypothetical protein